MYKSEVLNKWDSLQHDQYHIIKCILRSRLDKSK